MRKQYAGGAGGRRPNGDCSTTNSCCSSPWSASAYSWRGTATLFSSGRVAAAASCGHFAICAASRWTWRNASVSAAATAAATYARSYAHARANGPSPHAHAWAHAYARTNAGPYAWAHARTNAWLYAWADARAHADAGCSAAAGAPAARCAC